MTKHKNKKNLFSDAERLLQIKKLVVSAVFSDDLLMERFVLKGGNAIDLAFQAGSRASLDIDLSMQDDFKPEEIIDIRTRLEKSLILTFKAANYAVFGFEMNEKPEIVSEDVKGFWGGYHLTFKLIESVKFAELAGNTEALSRSAIRIGARGRFEVDISRFEYCKGKAATNFEGLQIFVYTPAMIVCEKLRAVCQQMPEYGKIIHRGRPGSARARDFVDIYQLIEHFHLDFSNPENTMLLEAIFDAKRVPLTYLDQLADQREFHRQDFIAVTGTVKPGIKLKGYDFYFDYALTLCEKLKPLWNK